ncbi:CRISPR-associated endoribonuclease Cse3 [Pilimelia anulata]|uniref:CRISPR-associated endoribonuclease Cse3 n=1 Tax=Pilimelia anulata TaxID=53371 RepID=A0A8J3B729_9ACTN|nr:type I-E CRISPR-associated protein Cas6/Cse3/CasE [Pilimelia anulata]GGJ92641.1 CRISPR-associated endoribonuclease Cse3 [Pilimelia anulata]
MAYLSQIMLNPLRRGGQRFLRNRQALHAAVLGGLVPGPESERVLWRLEPEPHRLRLLVLTRSAPSWAHVVEQAGWPGADGEQVRVRPYAPLLDRVARGRRFAFRLHANPTVSTKKIKDPSPQQERHLARARPRGVRLAHVTAGQQLTWLVDRLPRWGFAPVPNTIEGCPVRVAARSTVTIDKNDGNRVTLGAALFDGVIAVADPELVRRSLLDGVGPGKAYGLGLITLAPPAGG